MVNCIFTFPVLSSPLSSSSVLYSSRLWKNPTISPASSSALLLPSSFFWST